MMIIISIVISLIIGGLVGYGIFRYVATGKYNDLLEKAKKDSEVIKEKEALRGKGKIS